MREIFFHYKNLLFCEFFLRCYYKLFNFRGKRADINIRSSVRIGTRSLLINSGKITIGSQTRIDRDVLIESNINSITISENVSIHRNSNIFGCVYIGSNVLIAPNVYISSGTHNFKVNPPISIKEQDKLFYRTDQMVTIQDDCWLGVNTVVMPGVTIGKGAIVGAGSVVTKNVRPYTISCGMPAKPMGNRLEWSPPLSINLKCFADYIYVLIGSHGFAEGGLALDFHNSNAVLSVSSRSKACLLRLHGQGSDCQLIINGKKTDVITGQSEIYVDPVYDSAFECNTIAIIVTRGRCYIKELLGFSCGNVH